MRRMQPSQQPAALMRGGTFLLQSEGGSASRCESSIDLAKVPARDKYMRAHSDKHPSHTANLQPHLWLLCCNATIVRASSRAIQCQVVLTTQVYKVVQTSVPSWTQGAARSEHGMNGSHPAADDAQATPAQQAGPNGQPLAGGDTSQQRDAAAVAAREEERLRRQAKQQQSEEAAARQARFPLCTASVHADTPTLYTQACVVCRSCLAYGHFPNWHREE